jgi:hypothetical protein
MRYGCIIDLRQGENAARALITMDRNEEDEKINFGQ